VEEFGTAGTRKSKPQRTQRNTKKAQIKVNSNPFVLLRVLCG
jgi:hypothetical protein